MTNMIKIHNAQTGEIIEREMNAQELAEAAKLAQIKSDSEARRRAILDRLGISEEEAKLLLS